MEVAARQAGPYLQEAEHDRQDVLGVRSEVLVGGDTVDDLQDQLPQLLQRQQVRQSRAAMLGLKGSSERLVCGVRVWSGSLVLGWSWAEVPVWVSPAGTEPLRPGETSRSEE